MMWVAVGCPSVTTMICLLGVRWRRKICRESQSPSCRLVKGSLGSQLASGSWSALSRRARVLNPMVPEKLDHTVAAVAILVATLAAIGVSFVVGFG